METQPMNLSSGQGQSVPHGPRSWEMDAAIKIREYVLREPGDFKEAHAGDCHFDFAKIIEEVHRPIRRTEGIHAMNQSQSICDLMEETQRLGAEIAKLREDNARLRRLSEPITGEPNQDWD